VRACRAFVAALSAKVVSFPISALKKQMWGKFGKGGQSRENSGKCHDKKSRLKGLCACGAFPQSHRSAVPTVKGFVKDGNCT